MRKPATSLLAIGLFLPLSCSLSAQQTATPTSLTPTTTSTAKDPAQQNQVHPNRQSEPETTLRVDVNLVNVFVTVTDAHGAPVGGLTKENFVLLENDQPQKISVFDKESALPLSIGL